MADCETGAVRLYVPATVPDLLTDDLPALPASGVSAALRAALPAEDEEGLELSAFLTAADAAVLRIAELAAPPRRIVLSLEVPHAALQPAAAREVPVDLQDLPSLLGWTTPRWRDVVAIHLDEDEAAPLVTAAAAGDAQALEDLGEVDLLWYAPAELAALRAALGPAAPA